VVKIFYQGGKNFLLGVVKKFYQKYYIYNTRDITYGEMISSTLASSLLMKHLLAKTFNKKKPKEKEKTTMKNYKDILALESNLIKMEEAVADIINKDYC
jgi:hypothetical protein